MKTSNKILLAGVLPVLIFMVISISANRAIAEKAKREIKQVTEELDFSTIRVIDIRGGDESGASIFGGHWDCLELNEPPSAEWFRRSSDTLIINHWFNLLPDKNYFPRLEEIIQNGITVFGEQKDKPEEPTDEPSVEPTAGH